MLDAEFFRRARDGSIGPLEGLRVLDVTRVWSGPLAACVLADLGADVIRVELPHGRDGQVPPNIPGTGLSWFRETVHRNKRSVGLDLRDDADRVRFLALVATADIVIENYKPGTLAGWHVGYEDCRAVRPDLVYVSISGFGQYGPDAYLPAYDPAVQAAAGWMSLNGEPDGIPVRAPTFLADELAGLHGAIGALAALAHRQRTGEGQHVDVAMMDCLLFGSSGLPTLAATGAAPPRLGNETDFVVPANVYECTDGCIYLAFAIDSHWRMLAELIGHPEIARADGYRTNRERLANREAVNRLVAEWCSRRTVADTIGPLGEAGIVAAPVRSLADTMAQPQVVARHMLQETVLSNGSTAPLVGPAVKFARTPTRIRNGAPAPGADTEEVFAELAATQEKSALPRAS